MASSIRPTQQEEVTVRERLRRATHADHVRINRHPLLEGLTRPDYPLARYAAVLTAYFRFYQAMERAIGRFLAGHPCAFDYAPRLKLPWLARDLAALAIAQPAPPAGEPVPALEDPGALVGALYAIEGSTLGGQVIARHLRQHHGLTPERGAAFFHGYGEETPRLWQAFCDFAQTIAGDPAACAAAEARARATFVQLESLLDDHARPC